MSNDYPEPTVLASTVLHIAIACFAAGVGFARGERPPPIVADDPIGTWMRLARVGYEAHHPPEREVESPPPWLQRIQEDADERD